MDQIKILVVDDESRMRKLVKDFLVRQNYEVIEAADGEEALDAFYADKQEAERVQMQRRVDELDPLADKLKSINPLMSRIK